MNNVMFYLLCFIAIFAISIDSFAVCRSNYQKKKFDRLSGYPTGRKGFVVDHICALACGGIDRPVNMQYQTIKAGKQKDRWETTPFGCKVTCNESNSTKVRTVFNCK